MADNSNEPSLIRATIDKIPIVNSVVGYFDNHETLGAGVTAAAIDKVVEGSGLFGSAVGGGIAAGLKEMGLPTWASVLGGVATSTFFSHPFSAAAELMVVGAVGVYQMAKNLLGGNKPVPALAPAPGG